MNLVPGSYHPLFCCSVSSHIIPKLAPGPWERYQNGPPDPFPEASGALQSLASVPPLPCFCLYSRVSFLSEHLQFPFSLNTSSTHSLSHIIWQIANICYWSKPLPGSQDIFVLVHRLYRIFNLGNLIFSYKNIGVGKLSLKRLLV